MDYAMSDSVSVSRDPSLASSYPIAHLRSLKEPPVIEIDSALRQSLRMPDTARDMHRASLATTLNQLRSNGYVVLERLAPDELVDEVCTELEPWFAATPHCHGDFYGWNTTRFGSVLVKSRASHALVLNEQMLSIMHEVLGPH